MQNFSKNIDNWVIAKFKYLTFDPPKGSGGEKLIVR